MSKPKVLAFAGSARKESWNKKIIQIAAECARTAGAEVTVVDLAEFPMPLYDGDLEAAEGLPENARKLKSLFIAHSALLIASPEYNGAPSPLLKNVIDWVSRKEGDEAPLAAYDGKVAALLAASPGALGGLRGLSHLRTILSGIKVTVIPEQVAVPQVHSVIDDTGSLTDETRLAAIDATVRRLVDVTSRITG